MKILIATGLYPPEIGGPATYALLLEEQLPKRGVDIVTVPFGWVRHYPKGIRHIVYAYKLWQESRNTDVIYALDPISVGLPALFVSRISRKPFLIRLGGDYAWEQGRVRFGLTENLDEYLTKKSTRPIMVKLLASLQSFVTRRAFKVVAPSKYLKGVIEKWGVKSEKIVVIHSALYPIKVEETKEELSRQLLFTKPTIISAGRLVPWKGFTVLLEVIAELKNKYPEITLVIAGDGHDHSTLVNLAKAEGIEGNVRLVGRISKEALGASIKGADVFVLNTAYEGLSHQLIEVMDIGTPVVTTNAGGNPELITDGVNGFLVPFNDHDALSSAIKRLVDNPGIRESIVQSAKVRANDFREEIMIDKIERLLKSIHDRTIT